MPTVDEIVQLEAPRASVKPVGAEPYLLMLPRSEVAAAVPVPEVVPPADSTVRLIELSTVPVTVRVPDEVAAWAAVAMQAMAVVARKARRMFTSRLLFPSRGPWWGSTAACGRGAIIHAGCHARDLAVKLFASAIYKDIVRRARTRPRPG